MINVKIKLLEPLALIPIKATEGAAAFDLYSCRDVVLGREEIHKVKLGFAMEIPEGYCAYLRPRSGLAANHGITMCSSGIIDCDYRDEVKIPLINHGRYYLIKAGERVGQMLILPVPQVLITVVEELSVTNRRGGFGSTGK